MAYVYALINKDTLAYICREKGVSGDFIANKTKISATKLALWLTPTDSALPTIKQAKKLASCLHIPFAGLYMNSIDIPLKKIPNVRNMRTMLGTSSSDDSALNVAMIDVLLERDFLLNANDELGLTTKTFCLLYLKKMILRFGQMQFENNFPLASNSNISVTLHDSFIYICEKK